MNQFRHAQYLCGELHVQGAWWLMLPLKWNYSMHLRPLAASSMAALVSDGAEMLAVTKEKFRVLLSFVLFFCKQQKCFRF